MKVVFPRHRPEPHIPFISLADIAWQIIIFFLIAATFAMSNALNVDLPNSVAQQNNQPPNKAITVQATGTGVSIDGKAVDVADLQSTISKLLEGKKTENDKAVMVLGRDDLTFQQDVDIMYAIQKAGGILILSEDSAGGKGSDGEPAADAAP